MKKIHHMRVNLEKLKGRIQKTTIEKLCLEQIKMSGPTTIVQKDNFNKKKPSLLKHTTCHPQKNFEKEYAKIYY